MEEEKDFYKVGSKHQNKKSTSLLCKVWHAKVNIFKAHNVRNYTTDGNLASWG